MHIGLFIVITALLGCRSQRLPKPAADGRWTVAALPDLDVEGVRELADDGPVVVALWAVWCEPCIAEMPVLLKLASEYEPRGVVFLAASRDDPSVAKVQVGMFIDQRAPGLARHAAFADDETADAYGVLPPVAKLTRDQAMYYFLSGYTAKVAGTERGVKEPQATFSSCFGAVFLVWHPWKYAEMLGELIDKHGSHVWLVNTGWTGGPYGVGKRMALPHTRAMLRAALTGRLDGADFTPHPVFGVGVPKSCPDVPAEFLDARGMWTDKRAYDEGARALAGRFHENFRKFPNAATEIREAGPLVKN